jgi:hypothetical protein
LLVNSGPVQATDTTTPNPQEYPPPPVSYAPAYQNPAEFIPPPPSGFAPPGYIIPGYAPNIFSTAPPPSALPPYLVPDARGNLQVPCRVCATPIQYPIIFATTQIKFTFFHHNKIYTKTTTSCSKMYKLFPWYPSWTTSTGEKICFMPMQYLADSSCYCKSFYLSKVCILCYFFYFKL